MLLSIGSMNSQTNTNNTVTYSIYTSDYSEKKLSLEGFLKKGKYTIINQKESKTSHHYEFAIWDSDLDNIDSLCNTLGYVSFKDLKSFNHDADLKEAQLQLEQQKEKKIEFEKMQKQLDSIGSARYYAHWEKIRAIDEEINHTKKRILNYQSYEKVYTVVIELYNEQTIYESTRVNFVHMPGAEYVYFITENPKQGLSYSNYQGVNLKYVFTKGKSFFALGALKPVSKTDSTTFDEIFNLTFGQDWYSKHLGRGGYKFCNLYIGYHTGFTLAYNDFGNKWWPYVSPSTGLELFKNKYFLFDTNVSYYLPLSNYNRNMRGYKISGSINFTF